MKKQILIIATALLSLNTFGQISVKESAQSDKVWSSFTRTQHVVRFVQESDTSYTFYYKNFKYSHITDIQYFTIGSKEDVNGFLDLIQDVIDNKKEYDITLPSGDRISLQKTLNSCYVYTSKGFTYFDKNQIEKLRSNL